MLIVLTGDLSKLSSFSMTLEQAQLLRKKLLYLEGIIAKNTREYIWKVIIGPKERGLMDHFQSLVNPSAPIDPQTILQAFRQEELSVYFFLKTKGTLICREYREFLSSNDVQVAYGDPALMSLIISE